MNLKRLTVSLFLLASLVIPGTGFAVSEDYTTYVEVDPNNRYSVAATAITVTALTRNETAHVTFDFGAGNFGDIALGINFEMLGTASSANRAQMYGFGLSNVLKNAKAHDDANDDSIWVFTSIGSTGQRSIGLISYNGGSTVDQFLFGAWGTRYFLTFTRASDTAIAKIYDDSGRTNLVDTLTITSITTDTFRYLYGANSFDDDRTTNITGELANLDIVVATPPAPAANTGNNLMTGNNAMTGNNSMTGNNIMTGNNAFSQ